MQKNNRSRSASAAFLLVAIVAFLNASCSSKVSSGDTVIPAAVASSNNMQPLRNSNIKTLRQLKGKRVNSRIDLKLKSERVQ
ncbi:MAG: hypothetical protein WBF90_25415 [Rivularia sp. (in: cyanobacteria)]